MFHNKVGPEAIPASKPAPAPAPSDTPRTNNVKFNVSDTDSRSDSAKSSSHLRAAPQGDAELSPQSRRRTFVFHDESKSTKRGPSNESLHSSKNDQTVTTTSSSMTTSSTAALPRDMAVESQKKTFLANITEAALDESDTEESPPSASSQFASADKSVCIVLLSICRLCC
jgi:hypothetical protein